MNKTKAFINRVVIGVTLMTLAACGLNLQQQDDYNNRAGLMEAQFNKILGQEIMDDELRSIHVSFRSSHDSLKSKIKSQSATQDALAADCDTFLVAMQIQLNKAIEISQRTPAQKADAAAKQLAKTKAEAEAKNFAENKAAAEAKRANARGNLTRSEKTAIAAAEQEAKKAAEAAAADAAGQEAKKAAEAATAQAEEQNSSESDAAYYNIDATGNTPAASNQSGNYNQNGVTAPPPPPPPAFIP